MSLSTVNKIIFNTLIGIGAMICFVTPVSAQVTLSGTLYSDAGVTPQAVSKFIMVAVGTSTPNTFSTTTLTTTGAWTVTIPAGHGIGTSTPIMVWVNDDATTRATVLTKASSSASVQSITGLDLYQDRIIVRHEAVSGTSTTFADFSFYTSALDADLQHSTSSGLLTIAPGNELYIWGGDTFAPGVDVVVQGNASAAATDGSMYIATSSVYTAGGRLTLGGSLRIATGATYTAGAYTTLLNATTTGKLVSAPITSLGNLIFSGAGGAWSFVGSATTSDLTILTGTVVAPANTLAVTGRFQNDGTFTQNGGVLNMIGAATPTLADFVTLATARDASGMIASTSATSATAFAISGNTLYMAKAGGSQNCTSTASTTAGNCEILVFNIASTTNPVYITARDAGGGSASTSAVGVNYMIATGSMLYVAKAGSAVPCTQVAGTADGCELMVFDISSTTNPIFRAGRDADGTAAGTTAVNATSLAVSGNTLYMSKAAAGATACTTQANCELMVFNISSTTDPTYVTGRDVSGSAAGTQNIAINSIAVVGNALYTAKAGSGTACNPTAGSAVGCELMVFNISSTTDPVFATARDAGGSSASTSAVAMNFVVGSGTALYIAKAASAVPCSEVAGLADGCGVMVFDISSTTNPIYRRGVDAGGSYTGIQAINITALTLHKNFLYVGKAANALGCRQGRGVATGCELIVLDVASSTAIRMIAGRDAGGDATGVQSLGVNTLIGIGDTLYAGKAGSATSCTATAGNAVGCELMVFNVSRPASGFLHGSMTATNTLGSVVTNGIVEFRDNASTSNFTIATGSTTAPQVLTVSGDFSNSADFIAGEGELQFSSDSAQQLSGNLTGTSSLYRATFWGAGEKTFANNASTTILDIDTVATVVAPTQLSVAERFDNEGTFTAGNGTLHTRAYINEFVSSFSAGGSATDAQGVAFNFVLPVGTSTVYAAKAANATNCNPTAGNAVGCELMVFSTASTTNLFFTNGRDTSGSTTGTGNIAINTMVQSNDGQTLYVGKAGSATACNPTSGSASDCELTIFNIASTTNPIFVGAQDSSGSSTGSTSAIAITSMVVSGNYLYVGKAANTAPCTQVAGTAAGCELMVYDISSTTNPIYRAGRDADGNAAGVTGVNATGLAVAGNTLYMSKAAAGATACTTQANCELMVFTISSSTNPIYTTGRDVSGSAAGTGNIAINSIHVAGNRLYVGKAGSATACNNTAGNAVGCELMVFDISSTSNPVYAGASDVSGSVTGTGNLGVNAVRATSGLAYIAKAGDATDCSQVAGGAIGCELMVFDVSSSTNPRYMQGRDSESGRGSRSALAIQSLALASDRYLVTGRANDTTICEQTSGLRAGCELMFYNLPTTLTGILTGSSGLATVTTQGVTKFTASASTSQLTIATTSVAIAPTSTLSITGNLRIEGGYIANEGLLELQGTNQFITAFATTTFYDFRQIATAAATTTFSTSSPFVILRDFTMQGASTGARLRLRSLVSGTQWQIDPWSSTTINLTALDVQDSNNVSATTTLLTCGAGCLDNGNNTNWSIGLLLTISGTLYEEDGVTPYATATAMRLIVPISNDYQVDTTSTAGTGAYSFSIADQFLATGTPYVVFTNDAAAIKANTITKSSSTVASVSNLDLFQDHVILRSEQGSLIPITNSDLASYTGSDDTDIRYAVDASNAVTITGPAALVVWDNTQYIPGAPVTITGNANAAASDGSLYLRNGSSYTPTNFTKVAGSFRASSTATYTPDLAVLEFNATTTGKVIDSSLLTLGNVTFNGTGGAWSFMQSRATTSDFAVERGTVTAPSTELVVNGVFSNSGTFTNNSGTIESVGNTLEDNDRALTFAAGLDTQARKTGSGAGVYAAFEVVGNYLFVGRSADGSLTCSQTAGSNAGRCEIQVFNVSSTTNPTYVAGRDTDGSSTGAGGSAGVNDVVVVGNYLFVAKSGTTTPCSQTAGSAEGCELMVFNVASATNPTYVAGRDADASAAGTASTTFNSLTVVDHYLYVAVEGDATACSQVAGSAVGCELQIYDISDPTNPIYVAGRDGSGNSAGANSSAYLDLVLYGNAVYATKYSNATACSQTAGSATGCELHVYNVSSTTNPVYAAGRDASGNSAGTAAVNFKSLAVSDSLLYVGKDGDATACSQTAGSATGCELMVFSIASTTNPIYVAGRDSSGDATGTGALNIASVGLQGNNLYVGKEGQVTPCEQVAGQATGCELMMFDISSTTNPVFVAGRDNTGSKDGDQARTIGEILAWDNVVYIGKNGSTVNCAQTTVGTGAIGCEMMVYTSLQPAGVFSGTMSGASSLATVEARNLVSFNNNASTTNLTVHSSSTLTTPTVISLSGNLTNSGTLQSVSGGSFFASSSATQTWTGTATSAASFGILTFGGAGTKNVNINLTATDVIVPSGVNMSYTDDISITRDYINNGTVSAAATSELIFNGTHYLGAYVAGRDSSASAAGTRSEPYGAIVRKDNYIYVASNDNATACSQTAGSANGCELQVFDVSSTTNPVYVAGRDGSGSAAGTALINISELAIADNVLYVTKTASSTVCSQVAGSAGGCELMVFDISSTTNPIYVAGRDATGNSNGTGAFSMGSLMVRSNYLFVTLNSSTTNPCSQTAGSAEGCELQIYDISDPLNPIYVAGRDVSGSDNGTVSSNYRSLAATSTWLYVGKNGNSNACSQTAGAAEGCELDVYDITSPVNPTFVAGRDSSGDSTSTSSESIRALISRDRLLVRKAADATPCSQTIGFATGCEYMIFDISSSSNPVYIAGRDVSGDATGIAAVEPERHMVQGDYWYVTKAGDATPCSQTAGSATGCELMVFDISSSTNPIYVAGRDSTGNSDGTGAIQMNFVTLVGSNVYVSKNSDGTACSQVEGSAVGCELMVFRLGHRVRGAQTGASAHQSVEVRGPVEWLGNASTTDLEITSAGAVNAPATMTLRGNFTNNGSFYAREGTIELIGIDQSVITNATTTFHNLIQEATTTATTTFSATGGFVTTGELRLQGTSTARLKLRSTVNGSQWTILPLGTVSTSWLDVQDSRNASSTIIECIGTCIDRGNNTNWLFFSALGTGSSTLTQHTGGQVTNKFTSSTTTDDTLLAFRLETQSGSTTYSLAFGLNGVSGVAQDTITNYRLVRDHNNNRIYDGGDLLLTGVGDVTWQGDSATIGFYDGFVATTSYNYLVIADRGSIPNGSFMTIGIAPQGVSAIDSTGAQTILGSVVSLQHSRNNRGGGGGNSSIGGGAPAGDGDVGGGETGGGELIGNDPDFFWPTAHSGSWLSGALAYDGVDGTYATTGSATNHSYTNYGFVIPGANTISGIEVKLELSGSTAAGTVDVQLSWDGGTSWTSSKSTPTLTTSDVVRTLGSPSDVWGRTWAPGEFSNANFAVRIAGNPSSNTIRLDAIQVRIYHITSGGGGGGGGGGGAI
jgi:hypothetical protein